MSGMSAGSHPFIFASTGTDKRFPFIRLIRWLETWAAAHADAANVLVQAGITPCPDLPSVAEYHPEKMAEVLAGSDAAVLQGGPGGIMTARRNGLLPILVPRIGRLGEAVDDHQVEFGRWADTRGLSLTVETEAALHGALDAALVDRTAYRIPPEPSPTLETVRRVEARVERLLEQRRPTVARATGGPMVAGRGGDGAAGRPYGPSLRLRRRRGGP